MVLRNTDCPHTVKSGTARVQLYLHGPSLLESKMSTLKESGTCDLNILIMPTPCTCVYCEVRTAHRASVCSVRFSQPPTTVSPHSINRSDSVAET
jgi:hypothetical protein